MAAPIALLLMGERAGGEPEWWIVHGVIQNGSPSVFVRSRDGATVALEDEWIARIREVPPEHASLFAPAVSYIRLRIGQLPDDATSDDYVFTGLKLNG